MNFLVLVLLLLLALALDRDHAFVHRDVHARCPVNLDAALQAQPRQSSQAAGHQPVEQRVDLAEWIPTYHSHNLLLSSLVNSDQSKTLDCNRYDRNPRIYVAACATEKIFMA